MARGVDNVYFVGCGGSLYATYPVQFLMDTVADNLSAWNLTSNEFNFRRPRRLGERSLVVVASHTGRTKETVAAIETARAAGAAVLGVTRLADSPLATGVDEAFTYGSDTHRLGAEARPSRQIGHGLIEASGTAEDTDTIRAAYEALPEAMEKGLHEQDPRSRDAEQLRTSRSSTSSARGPVEGVARCLSMCYLQEMQWMHSAAFNSGEFFHGAFEVVTDEVPVILFAGEDSTRPMADRALSFLRKYTKKVFVVDSRDLSLPGIPPPPGPRWPPSPSAPSSRGWRSTSRRCAGTTSRRAGTCSKSSTDATGVRRGQCGRHLPQPATRVPRR